MDVRDFINMLNSVVALSCGDMKNVKHEEVAPYPTWADLLDEVEYVGGDIARITRIVAGDQAGRVLKALAEYKKPAKPELTLTTAHKSKGREFDILVLADDFPSVYGKDGEWVGLEDAEVNLLYVAVTRTKKVLITNTTVNDILQKSRKRGLSIQVREIQQAGGAEAVFDQALIREMSLMEDIEHDLEMSMEDGLNPNDPFTDRLSQLGIMKMPELDKACMANFGIMPSSEHCF
ncbi:hypothetical protein D3C78_906470 [compost metagenome]